MQTNMFGKSVYLLVGLVLGVLLLWISARKPSKKSNEFDVLSGGHVIELQHGSYLFALNSDYKLAVSVEEEGKFSLRLYNKTNNFSNHIRFTGVDSFISFQKKIDDVTTLIVDEDCDGIPDFRVIRSDKTSDMPVKENLKLLAEPKSQH